MQYYCKLMVLHNELKYLVLKLIFFANDLEQSYKLKKIGKQIAGPIIVVISSHH